MDEKTERQNVLSALANWIIRVANSGSSASAAEIATLPAVAQAYYYFSSESNK